MLARPPVDAHSEKKQRLHEVGGLHVIVTREQDMLAEVMRITDGNGARVAFDPVGGPDFPKLIAALTFQGIVKIQHPAGGGRRGTPEGRGGVRHEGPRERYAQAGHRSYVQVRRNGETHRYLENIGQFGKIVVTI
jgi:hypothetical protein